MIKLTLTQVKEKATDLAQTGLVKSSQMTEIAKLQISNMTHEDVIKKAYFELGKRYYEQYGDKPESAYEASCQKVSETYKAIAKNKARIKELRNPDIVSIYDLPDDVVDIDIEEVTETTEESSDTE